MKLNLANIMLGTRTLGPGRRAGVWVQGCPFRCRGCIAPEWQPFKPGIQVSPKHLAAAILAEPQLSGVTLSGGEPLSQAEALCALLELLKKHRHFDVICFTGYRLEEILRHPPSAHVLRLLDQVDVLIDGPYQDDLKLAEGLRGSSNQRFHYLSRNIAPGILESWKRPIEVKIDSSSIQFAGIPDPGLNIPYLC